MLKDMDFGVYGKGIDGYVHYSLAMERIREEELDIDCLSMREMEKKWGKEHFREYYGKIRTAVQETEGLVAEYDGELIEPFYCCLLYTSDAADE